MIMKFLFRAILSDIVYEAEDIKTGNITNTDRLIYIEYIYIYIYIYIIIKSRS